MEPLCHFENITVKRGGQTVLDGLTLRIERCEKLAILGPNGCGKSTLIKTILRELFPIADANSYAAIMGQQRWDVFELRQHLGVVSGELQRECWRDISVKQMVVSGFFGSMGLFRQHEATAEMWQRSEELMGWLGCAHLADRAMNTLSTGQIRRVLITRALVNSPETLLLDEPGNGLDPAAQQRLRQSIHQIADAGHGIILVTHNLPDITSDIHRVVTMKNGRILHDGTPSQILTSKNLTELFDTPIHVHRSRDSYHITAAEA
ncbi:MAG: ABC transporter ATP-binding protein [Armatimonadota bacterium]